MNTKRINKIKKVIRSLDIDTKLLRVFVADVVLAALSIAWLSEHLKNMDHSVQVYFASLFVGLVLYFKHKN